MSEIDQHSPVSTDVLWRQHSLELTRFATMLVGPADASDVVSDVFLRMERNGTAAMDSPRSYLYRAIVNQANTARRAQVRRRRRDLAAVGPVSVGTPDTFVDVRRAISTLTLNQRAVVYLAYWRDLSEREIADRLDFSPGTVHRHLMAARQHLREVL